MIVWWYQPMRTTLDNAPCWVVGRVRSIHEHRLDIEYLKDGAHELAPIKRFGNYKLALGIARKMNTLTS